MAKKQGEGFRVACTNKKARRDYDIDETLEAGIVLWGNEVKSLRDARANLMDAYAWVQEGEVWLSGLHVSPYSHTRIEEQDPTRDRKLLLHAKEIKRLAVKIQEKGYTVVPLRIYFKRGIAKVEIGLGKGKKLYDKREDVKKADARREIERVIKNY